MPAAKFLPQAPSTSTKTLRHVLAAVIADAFDYRGRSRIANGKALARHSVEKCFAAGGAVKRNVADQNIFSRGRNCDRRGGYTTKRPPDKPLPT